MTASGIVLALCLLLATSSAYMLGRVHVRMQVGRRATRAIKLLEPGSTAFWRMRLMLYTMWEDAVPQHMHDMAQDEERQPAHLLVDYARRPH